MVKLVIKLGKVIKSPPKEGLNKALFLYFAHQSQS